ncbi:PurR Transcriptional regulators [Fimbriimonadaceae bacterium]
MTIGELAKMLNLSKSTVSYALNNGPKPVSPEVKQRVLKAAEEFGFRPNPVARSLANRRSRTIGFIPNALNPATMYSAYAAVFLQSTFSLAHERELHLLLPSGYDPARSDETREHLFNAPVDGFILLLPENLSALRDIIEQGRPMIAIAGKTDGLIPSINADNALGASQAFDHIWSLGHRKIAYLGSTTESDTSIRFNTTETLFSRVHSEFEQSWLIRSGANYDPVLVVARELLSQKSIPTAIICVNDLVASAVLRAALELRIRVPEQLSIIGFDDDSVARTMPIPLSTIRQPIPEMAVAAMDGILAQIEGNSFEDQTLATSLIVRETTSAPP